MAHLLPNVRQQFLDDNGVPVANGKLYSYVAGTSTPLATYSSQSELAANANPLILDSNGIGDVWLGSGIYKLVLKTSADVTIWTRDNVAHLSPGAVVTSKLADGALSADAEGRAKMADGFLTPAKFASSVVDDSTLQFTTNLRVKDGGITRAKLAAVGHQISSSSGSFSTTSTTPVDVTNLSVSLTTTGRPVRLGLIPDGSVVPVYSGIQVTAPSMGFPSCEILLVRDSTQISLNRFYHSLASAGAGETLVLPPGAISHLDDIAAGTYTYKVQAFLTVGGTVQVLQTKLYAYEL